MEQTKQELLNIMYVHLNRQQQIAEMKYQNAIQVEEEAQPSAGGSKRTKKENTDLKEYNNQVDAVGRTVRSIIALQKSDIPDAEEESSEDEELV